MATADVATPQGLGVNEEAHALAVQLRKLNRVATVVALLTSPALIIWLERMRGWPLWAAILAGIGSAICFRGFVDVVVRSFVPWPSLFGVTDDRERRGDVTSRRRAWFWRTTYKRLLLFFGPLGVAIFALVHYAGWQTLIQIASVVVILPFYLLFNFVILFGPLMLVGITQMRGFEPGDADWGVRLGDVRGQAEAKEEVRKIVTLWQSGEVFERAGGKRERGLLFHGPPGTGKTMLAKAIATSFNAPFISMPGSGFAQTFIGMDAVIVRWLARKAKRMARKWGGQCIVFIDEIDAVGMRRASLQEGTMTSLDELAQLQHFYGPFGAVTRSGDLVVESAAWRDHLFAQREPERRSPYPGWLLKAGRIVDQAMPGGMFGMGGQLALNQLLVVMDGLDSPPFMRRVLTSAINKLLDAVYIVPLRVGSVSLRLRPPKPRKEQIYFIGATNVPLQNLDPALTRPGRMGRHVWFRTPTKDDRKDIFDLYLGKVAHDEDLDTPKRRDEVARITNGYSPAMIDQVCSVALTYAHHDGRTTFSWRDLLEAMSVIESGTAINVKYVEHETRAVALHEAGHAAAAHVYRPEVESSRLSIRMRPGSLGHHQSFEREERFTKWQREYFGDLVHGLAAMAAERVFYNENASGVSGDLEYATYTAATMAGISGMGPMPITIPGTFADESLEQTRKRVMDRFERIGLQLMNRTRGSADAHADPIASILRDPTKRTTTAQILGQAFVTAYNFVRANRDKVEHLAEKLISERELYGDDLLAELDRQHFEKPQIDWASEDVWPSL